MITKENLREVLQSLGFIHKDQIYAKSFDKDILQVNFKTKELIYPKQILIHDKTTSNFSHPENFVVFECVHRLLQKGYKARHLELEPRWNLGRDKKGGKADILVKDNEDKPYLLIECKTTDSKNSEFEKEWSRMQEDGGQLFSYLQQEKGVKYLCLYTSDFRENTLTYENYIINTSDNEQTLKQTNAKGYKDALNNIEIFKVWRNTYASDYQTSGIFEENIQAYKITQIKPTLETLKFIDYTTLQRKRHQWATILRASSVGDRGNALNKIMNLLLCKITDEVENTKGTFKELQFSWGGFSADNPFDLVDRLQKLYQIGMKEYLKQEITYYSKDSIDEAFSNKYQDTPSRQHIEKIFEELKYFQNGDFNFIEVYNQNLFNENFNILLQVVLMLEDIKFSDKEHSQFLGDFFENYIQDMPQHEGQYFTPVPLVNFIIHSLPVLIETKVLDYACGAGHFLSEYAKINSNYSIKYQGVDKDPRLAKISAISSFMQGENIRIDYENSLKESVIKNNSVNTIIANPPYAVDGFLRVLDQDERENYELFNKNISLDTDKIECFFIEKASKSLQSYGLLSLVLPSSIFNNNDSITIQTREILLRDFFIIAVCEFGNQTFFKTGTNPIILFAIRKSKKKNNTTDNNIAEYFYEFITQNKAQNKLENPYKTELDSLLRSYALFMDYELSMLENLFFHTLENIESIKHSNIQDYFQAYKQMVAKERNDYNNKKSQKYRDGNPFSPSLSLQEFIKAKEAEKFLYFCYCKDSAPLIINAPKDNEEQKKFLGYYWSAKKGQEGIHYITKDNTNENNINSINTPLFNPKNRFCKNSISFAILSHFIKHLQGQHLNQNFYKEFKKQEQTNANIAHIKQAKLIDMIDFEKVEFNKAISLNLSSTSRENIESLWGNCKYELVKLGEIAEVIAGQSPQSQFYNNNQEGLLFFQGKKDFGERFLQNSNVWTTQITKESYKNDILLSVRAPVGAVNLNPYDKICIGRGLAAIRAKNFNFLFILMQYNKKMFVGKQGMAFESINTSEIKNIKIPLPPLEIQKQIVAECEKVEEQYNTIRMSIEEYQKLIKAILIKCGICEAQNIQSTNSAGG